jgi:D-lactate dehydrogenase (cytochrome)
MTWSEGVSPLVTLGKSIPECSPLGKHLTSSHVGDGNVHSLPLFSDEKELEIVREAVHDMVHRAIALDGTCTGEHGVGVGKVEYMSEELGEGTVGLMETVKRNSEFVVGIVLTRSRPTQHLQSRKDLPKHKASSARLEVGFSWRLYACS